MRKHEKKGSNKGNYGKVSKATPQTKKKANKLPKPSKHHDVKPKRKKEFTSIKQRMQLVQRNSQSSRAAHAHKDFKTGYSFSKANAPEFNNKKSTQKKKKKKGVKKRAFQMNISQSNEIFLKRVDVPWYNSSQANAEAASLNDKSRLNNAAADQDSNDDDNDNHDMALLQLPPESILSSIDSDIASFCAYIKLGPVELKARQAFLDEITGIALYQFGKGGRNRNSRANNGTEDEISVVPFGSFATQSVCTFASDVDMCLWGVVKGEKQPEHTTFVDDDTDTSQRDADILGKAQHDECPLLTESALLRTMEAIQNSSRGENQDEQKKDTPKSEKKEEAQSQSENDNNDLFFIDRVGEQIIDDSEKQGSESCDKSATAENKPAPKKGFQFEIDLAGVKELGGDVEDLNECTQPNVKKDQNIESENTGVPQKPAAMAKTEQPVDEVCDNNDKPQKAEAIPPAGKTKETAIEVDDSNDDDDGSKSDVIVIDSDDDDDADKMAAYYSRQSITSATDNLKSSNSASPINLLHSDDSSCESAPIEVDSSNDDDDIDSHTQGQENEVMELSLTSSRASTQQPLTKPVIGPTGKTRNKVVSVLLSLTNQLRRSSFTHTIECRSRARVPIINCSTRTGFEGDIAIGGHNGLDTSTYARSQVDRFKSFAPIILLMKTLMNQQGLDKPFTGGLGSYKLYVLVAYHIETHIANGGNDRPSEILLSLLFRFGCVGSRRDRLTTDLVRLSNSGQMITSDGGICELTPVFRLPDCVEMFRESHERLTDRCLLIDDCNGAHQCSYLSSIIDCHSLREAREASKRRASLSDNIITRPTPLNHPGKVSAGRRISHVFTRNGSSVASKPDNNKRKNTNESAGYKRSKSEITKRGPRGGLIPKQRPDLTAKKSLGAEAAVIQRGMKQRKNKKKQSRDKELTRFAQRHSI